MLAGEGAAPAYDVGLLTGVLEGLAGLERLLRGDGLSAGELTGVVEGLGHVDALAMAARIRAISAADRLDVESLDGAASTADWLATALRTTRAKASRQVRDARLLVDDDETMAALATGQLSRGQAVEMAASLRRHQQDQDAAKAAEAEREERERRQREAADAKAQQEARDAAERLRLAKAAAEREKRLAQERIEAAQRREREEREARERRNRELLNKAKKGVSPDDLRQAAKDERATDPDALERDHRAKWQRRHLRRWRDRTTDLAMYSIGLPDDADELFQTMLEAAHTFDHPKTPVEERRTPEQRRADAFVDVLGVAAAAGKLPTRHGVKPHVTVTAPASTVAGGDEPGEGSFGATLSPETVRKLACDAGLTRAILNATGQVLDVGRETQRWTSAQYKAMAIMYGGCAFPVADGTPCGRPIGWTDIHHVTWYRNGGSTSVVNGLPLCGHHHDAVHHDGWALSLDFDQLVVTVKRTRGGRTVQRSVNFAERGRPAARAGAAGVAGPVGAAPPAGAHDGRLPL